MQTRLKNPAGALPGAMQAIQDLVAAIQNGGVPPRTLALAHLRASQINGCAACMEIGTRQALKDGETGDRLNALGAWRESPSFSADERAALALTEAVTQLDDPTDPVPDAIWNEAAKYYDETALPALLLSIATTNLFNRVNIATRQSGASW